MQSMFSPIATRYHEMAGVQLIQGLNNSSLLLNYQQA